jgi:hypothetical protein
VVDPGSFSAATVGDDCALRVGADYTYSVQIPTDGLWTFSLCGGATWDTYLYLTDACCGGTILAQNDDACGLQSEIACLSLTAGTYYVDVEPFSGGSGAFTLNINQTGCIPGRCCYNNFTSCADVTLAECNTLGGSWDGALTCATPCENPCVMSCGPNDIEEEVETNGCPVGVVDDPNGGCNNVVPTYTEIACGDTACAEAFTCPDGSGRDTDWFRFTVTEEALVTVSASSEFNNLLFGIVSGIDGCVAPAFVVNGFVTDCQAGWQSVSSILQPGNYVAFGAFGAFTGLPLGGDNTYRITVNGCAVQTPCEPVTDLAIVVETVAEFPNNVKLFWTAPQDEDYKVWSTINPNNDGNPDDGADPDWTLEATLLGLTAGPQTWTAPAAFVNYKNYNVTAVCEPFQAPVGRCCYGNFECADVTETECDNLAGTWSQFLNCTANPCPPPPPANDDCGNALPISNGVPTAGHNIGAVTDWVASCTFDDADVWYVFNATTTSLVTVTTCDPVFDFDTTINILDACGAAIEVGCNDDSCVGNSLLSTATFTPAAPGNYWIRVAGFAGQEGNFTLTVTQ